MTACLLDIAVSMRFPVAKGRKEEGRPQVGVQAMLSSLRRRFVKFDLFLEVFCFLLEPDSAEGIGIKVSD